MEHISQRKNVSKIIDTFNYIGISIDGIGEGSWLFQRSKGSYDKSINAIKIIQSFGGNAGIRFTITKRQKKFFVCFLLLLKRVLKCEQNIFHLVLFQVEEKESWNWYLKRKKELKYVDFMIKNFLNTMKTINIDIVTGNGNGCGYAFERVWKRYPFLLNSLKNRLKAWGGNSAGEKDLEIWIGMVLLSPDPFFPLTIGNYTKRFW